jgi:hypothetical protein
VDTDTATELVMEALAHAIAGDVDEAATALMTLGQRGDGNLMYGVCCALASAGEHFLRRIYGDRAPQPESGDLWVMQQLHPGVLAKDPPKAFAMRFLVASANQDTATCLALYEAAYKASDDEYVDSIGALLADVAGIGRLAIEQQQKPS